ncbi:polyprenol phosphomannose-dependent alpha 1,6 mannosyltransferase MptB [Amycolatopsis jiangsuensis]|uniref:Alpha-1,6-mannosyltransferase n=1 Tax=Amycolatopsis jiangsuensis TaxID=1181879 RepID=A0A840IW71_9PSEU|nr:polyprenol phosphomannose-dependent alpha 1,6 mannosyltransferase MptB [Amycolatopsis jiangsuensis]MBB4685577.1 alpha-1,6-mannosyltransferase [Amycolatopsis jiangsuensis]
MIFAGRCTPHRFATRLGLAGMGLIALGALGAGATLLNNPVLTRLLPDATGSAKTPATAVVYVGMGLLFAAWVRLGHLVQAGMSTMQEMRRTVWLWAAPLLVAPPLFSTDLYTYLAQGAVAQAGLDPYSHVPAELSGAVIDNAAGHWLSVPSPYGPLFILIIKSVLGLAGDNPLLGAFLTRLVLTAGLWLLCLAMPKLCRHLGGRPASALWISAANPLVLLHLVSGGHNDLLMVGLLASGTALVLARFPVRGFALVAMAAAVKVTAAVALPFLVWVWVSHRSEGRLTWRHFLRVGTAAVSTVVVSFGLCSAVAGVSLGWLSALDGNMVLEPLLSVPTSLGKVAAMMVSGVDTEQMVSGFRTAGWFVLAAVVVVLWWRSRRGGATAIRGAAGAMLATVLLSPVTLPWYFSWPLTLGAAVRWPSSRAVLPVVAGVSAWLVIGSHPDGKSQLPPWGFAVLFVASIAVGAGMWHGKIARSRAGRPVRLSGSAEFRVSSPGWESPAMRADLRDDLKVALKSRDRAAVTALRSALAAIDNAEAVPVGPTVDTTVGNERVAGVAVGLGAAEVPRRDLTDADVRSIVENEVRERTEAAEQYERLGRAEQAEQLRAEAAVLQRHLEVS